MNPFVTKPSSINGKIDSRKTVVFHNLLLHYPHHHYRHRLIGFGTHIKRTPHTAVSVSWPVFFWLNESRFNVQKIFFSLTYFPYFNSFRRRAHTFSRLVKSECIISHRRYRNCFLKLARASRWVSQSLSLKPKLNFNIDMSQTIHISFLQFRLRCPD